MDGFDWSPAPPFVPPEPGEDGWCVRDAICELLRWVRGSAEWSRFIQGPRGRDVPRLASHLGLTNFEFPGDWNEFIKRMAHPGVAVFDFPAYEKSHAVYVHDVRWLAHHWPRPGRPPASPHQRPLRWFGWPLGPQHVVRRPELAGVLVDERQPPH